jgi:hypothetical protein
VLGTDFFSYLAERPEEAARFSTAMAGVSDQLNRMPAGIDLTNVSVAVDVGGGTGALVRGLLRTTPRCAALTSTCRSTRPRPGRRPRRMA